MNKFKNFAADLKNILSEEDIKLDEPMKNHISFKVGGPADILVTPKNYDKVLSVLKMCNDRKVPYYIMGNGSNLLVKDGGIRGVVVKLTKLNKVKVQDNRLIVGSGLSLKNASQSALNNNLTGFEFACGIPGSVGGAVTMNAGAYNGEISNIIESVVVIDDHIKIKRLNLKQLELGYRMSSILKYGYTVLEVVFKLKKGEHDNIYNRIQELNRRRREKQPLEYPSAGSTFKRPKGYFAAKLIEDSGLKGRSIGGAQVSEKHSGFIVNKGNATSKDILDLIKIVQDTVKKKFDVDLYTEVRIIGED